jgi:hypothetical protein
MHLDHTHEKGVGAFGVIVVISFLMALAGGLSLLIASSHRMAIHQYNLDQAFLLTEAAFEFSSRQVTKDGNTSGTITMQMANGGQFVNQRINSYFKVTSTKGNAVSKFHILDPKNVDAGNFEINLTAAVIDGLNDVELQGITIKNIGTSTIRWAKVNVEWTDLAKNIIEIQTAGVQVWSGSAVSDTEIDITDVVLTAGETKTINFFKFNGDMSGNTFIIEFEMKDRSTQITNPFTPADG